ncbi:Zn-ribbon domain-containing OB-fold protein [Cumulibacter manganitolerans]|uniref:Zn-ribbon domain-containing OB-fold protein n=1 Tax=Cumulibacter manganitolerans TaxID=1884992 RepID=UPI0012952540|nr:OB-fold domain-containing protein [Cumulibacter manganitolerans]
MGSRFKQHRISGGIGGDDRFWEALEDGELRLCRCGSCGAWQWPAHFRCGRCGSWEHDWPLVEPVGTVYSWTRTHMAFPRTTARAESVPYVVLLVEVDGTDGARLHGVLEGPADALAIGARVRGTIHPPADESLGYPSLRWALETAEVSR